MPGAATQQSAQPFESLDYKASGWLNIAEAVSYSHRTEWEIRHAVQPDPFTGKPHLTHTRGSKDKLLFRREWLDQWNLRNVRHAE